MKKINGRVIKCNSNKFVIDVLTSRDACNLQNDNNVGEVLNAQGINNLGDFQNDCEKDKAKNPQYLTDDKQETQNYIVCNARKKIKQSFDIVTGDFAELEYANGEYILDRVMPRKNLLIRPPVANIDSLIIVAAAVPQVDFALIDKLIINAHSQGIKAILCINKTDMDSKGLISEITAQYGSVIDDIIKVSASNGDLEALKPLLTGNLSCLAGQSAVGKSSLINALTGSMRAVGGLSEKILRGKNTTVGVELIKLADNTYIIDTPGFSMLDIHNIKREELDLYFDEFLEFSRDCRFNRCTHTAEPDCNVKRAVESGELNRCRYERYRILFDELKKADKY